MSSEIIYSDATRLAELIRTREVSPVEVMQAHLDRIEVVNPRVNAIVTVVGNALEAARAAEAAVLAGDDLGPLHGVPISVKDSIDTADVLTQRGSPIFKGRIPEVDAVSVARLKRAGAIVLAKTNLPEFSYSTETDNLLTGRSNNPGISIAPLAGQAAESRRPSRRACRRWVSAPISPSLCAARRRKPASSRSRRPMGASR
jgi:Asp-tRNA(Asn)/Glu-tRNA(Gln) amidotransferase A subunit family amidase